MIRQGVEAFRNRGLEIGICGQAPSDYPDEVPPFLVDCGIGDKIDAKVEREERIDRVARIDGLLESVELTCDDIDIVIMTHLHFASAGGLMTTQVAKLPVGMTTGEAIERIRGLFRQQLTALEPGRELPV